MGVLGEVNNTWSLKRLLVIFLFRFRFHCILEIILNLWSLDFCKRFLRVLFFGVLIYCGLIMFSKLIKFSKIVMYLNSCSMDLGRDKYCSNLDKYFIICFLSLSLSFSFFFPLILSLSSSTLPLSPLYHLLLSTPP